MRPVRPLFAIGALCLAAWPFLARVAPHGEGQGKAGRVLVVGIEGAKASLFDDFRERGWMPQLEARSRRSVRCDLKGNVDPALPGGLRPAVSWTLVSTGHDSETQGITDLEVPDSSGYASVPIPSTERSLPTFWEAAAAYGRKVAVVGWWNTWPADAVGDGVLVSDRYFLDRFDLGPDSRTHAHPLGGGDLSAEYASGAEALTEPQALADRLTPVLSAVRETEEPLLRLLSDLIATERDPGAIRRLDGLRAAVELDRLAVASLRAVQSDGPFDLQCCTLRSLVPAMSWFASFALPERWRTSRDPRVQNHVAAPRVQRYGALLGEVVRFLDARIAELEALAGEDATLVLVSALGFDPPSPGASIRRMDLDPVLVQLGLQVRQPDGSIDWSRTTAFDRSLAPFSLNRNVDLNFVGDFPQGIVPSDGGRERGQAWDPVRKAVLDLKVDPPWAHPLEPDRHRDSIVIDQKALLPERWATQFFVYNGYTPGTRLVFSNGAAVDVDRLFPLEVLDAKLREDGMLWVVQHEATAGTSLDRLEPFGEFSATRTRVAPTVLALLGLPIPDSMPQPRYDLLPRPVAERAALSGIPAERFFLEDVGRQMPDHPAGARHLALRRALQERGWSARALGGQEVPVDRPPTVPPPRGERGLDDG